MTSHDDLRQAIMSTARGQLATVGAGALSPEGVATAGGLSASDVHAAYGGRDDLLTALIIDAYNASGAAMAKAEEAARQRGEDPGRRMLAATRALREWSLANTAEFTLIYGSPVPGYEAPPETVPPAARTPAVIATVLRAALEAGTLLPPSREIPGPPLVTEEAIALFGGVPEEPFSDLIERGIVFWSNLIGLLIFEVFSRTHDSVLDQTVFFDYAIAVAAESVGLVVSPEPASG